MEANFFRHLALEAGESLVGRRIEKIHAPADNVWTLRLDGKQSAKHLLFRPAKNAGLLFFSDQKPSNPFTAPAKVMWLRKRISGRRISSWQADWPSLRLALELTPSVREDARRFLIFDLREGLHLCNDLDEHFGHSPDWPSLEDALNSEEIWREFPQISPPLRKRLATLDPIEARELYFTVARGDRPTRFHASEETDGPGLPLVWSSPGANISFQSALDAAAAFGTRSLFPDLELHAERPELILLKRQRKKISKALAKLEQEQRRLGKLLELRLHGEALQANLYKFTQIDGQEHRLPERLSLEHPTAGLLDIELDPTCSPSENMERLFHQADKGKRGFVHMARRRNELGKELARLEAEGAPLSGPLSALQSSQKRTDTPPAPLPKRWHGLAVSLFTTDDGFTVIRGKNKKANHDMLSRAASPFDYWFHASGGPSSHVILKRDHPAQDVPERSMLQAASLCALKSASKDDNRVEIMFALVKNVRKVKGWDHGKVAVDVVQGSLSVRPDVSLEERLQRKT